MNKEQGRALKILEHLSTCKSARLWAKSRKLETETPIGERKLDS